MERSIIDTPTQGVIKVNAIGRGAKDIGREIEVVGHKGISSGVPEQPYTVQLGFAGGVNRVNRLRSLNGRLALENFVEQTCIVGTDTNLWNGTMVHDLGAVVARKLDGSTAIASSVGIRFQQEHYFTASRLGFALHTVGEVLAQDEKLRQLGVDKDPHNYYTGGMYNREMCLAMPISLVLMDDLKIQGVMIERAVRERIRDSGLRLPRSMRVISTSKETLKNAANGNVLRMLEIENRDYETYDGTDENFSGQITNLTDGFQAAFNRIEAVRRNDRPRRVGDLVISSQSCLCPVTLGVDTRYLDMTPVLIERIDENLKAHYYSSVSVGTEFPRKVVMEAVRDGVTVGQKMAAIRRINAADVQKELYGVSRQVILEEAVFVALAQMGSGLEVR